MDISNLFHCLNVDTDIPKSEWVQKKKDPNKTKTWFLMVLKNGVILRALFLRSHFIEILLYASKISKS